MSASDTSLATVITGDHRVLEQMFRELETLKPSLVRKERADHMITELVRHLVAEERVFYPLLRQALPEQEGLVKHELTEHADAKRVAKQLEHTGVDHREFDRLLHRLLGDLRRHMRAEEDSLLPPLQHACPAAQLLGLGERLIRARDTAPTRPHPAVPTTPAASRLLVAGLARADRIRNAVTGRTQ